MIKLYDEITKSDLHDEILNKFLSYLRPKINHKIYKLPENNSPENFQFNRVVLLCDHFVYKIHPAVYSDFQKQLVNNLRQFFKFYSNPPEFQDYYLSDICWIKWNYIEGQNLGLQTFGNDIWGQYLNHVNKWWSEHLEISKNLYVKNNLMWWHNDMTALNVIIGSDKKFHLIDWDDFKLCKINEAKEKMINTNIQYAKIMNQNIKILNKKLRKLL